MTTTATDRLALVTGATGYIGSQLVPRLLKEGWRVRVLTRHASGLHGHEWADRVDVVEGDASTSADLDAAMSGVDVAFYLIHSMDGAADFRRRDREMAATFADAADRASVGRIVYLSGLHPADEELSPHLASRVEVGEVFLAARTPAAVLQAAVILGDGSASFDMLRYLTHRLPAMVAPRWLNNRIQPIAIQDVLHYLAGAATLPPEVNRTFDIGGPDVLTYRDMMQRFASITGLRRRIVVTVPVLTPQLAGHWVGLVTPVSSGLGKPLVQSLVHEVVCQENDLAALVGPPEPPTGFDDAVRDAMRHAAPDHAWRNLARTGAATAACAVVGSIASDPTSRWYRSLDLPPWQPPPLAFPIVWTALYADIAASSAATLTAFERERRTDEARSYGRAFGLNLILNAGWSALFFRAHRPAVAAVGAGALAASSADLVRRAGRVSKPARTGLALYAGWCAFATALSAEITRRNR
ncbi:tryptophan-rich sensory protein [Luteipulveratus flavus]|uniref:Tryptophan-rich sensory protein n=1 Tax=Luteipulveratus flavus TaxID=3031728 RepID=A0ABT6C375_9MICO|nr:tryptophan-rich sensory protein [Luteipulveratus sp. YIM 133296]MDF8263228.1 tryptophan-rich sensory protein [Luteipulveratus sp. YIM 133296]